MKCEYEISAEPDKRIVLNITQFQTESDQDYLSIFNGNSTKVKHLEQYVFFVLIKTIS